MRKIFLAALGLALLTAGFHHFIQTDYSLRQNEHRRKLGAVYMTLNNPFYEVIDEEIRTVVENHGDVLISRDPALSVERQVEEIRELIASGVELIFINPVDWTEVEPALELAHAAKIPVIAIDTNVEDDSLVACTVVSDNYTAGVQCAEHLLKNSSGGKIALLKHSQARSSIDRIKGFRDKISANKNFQIVAESECLGQLEVAMPAMEKMIRAHPEINIVMALNDPAAMGALAALQNINRRDVKVYGVDGVPETKEMIFSRRMTATAGQSPRQIGRLAADQAYKILAGEPVEKIIKLPTKLLSAENISAADLESWD
ncbi:MAG: sugar ABC transporter substrate-binding protein [Selenomonadaceae bacterium]|nr:sugar ABC transporter substrate-binding protein [Selenomonadaceae bacterium]MBQ3727132.1 sugar ABC transporter substrate-binding protein [Selenomonadaceae bacterium]